MALLTQLPPLAGVDEFRDLLLLGRVPLYLGLQGRREEEEQEEQAKALGTTLDHYAYLEVTG